MFIFFLYLFDRCLFLATAFNLQLFSALRRWLRNDVWSAFWILISPDFLYRADPSSLTVTLFVSSYRPSWNGSSSPSYSSYSSPYSSLSTMVAFTFLRPPRLGFAIGFLERAEY